MMCQKCGARCQGRFCKVCGRDEHREQALTPESQSEPNKLLDRQLEILDTTTIRDRFVSGYRSVRSLPVDYEQRAALYDFRQ